MLFKQSRNKAHGVERGVSQGLPVHELQPDVRGQKPGEEIADESVLIPEATSFNAEKRF
jgi:hypothetical protein